MFAELNIEIYDLTGKVLKKSVISGQNGEIDMQELEPSMYLLKINVNGENRVMKIIKK